MLKRVPKLEQKLWRLLMLPFRMFVLVVSPTIYLSYLLGAPLVNSFNGQVSGTGTIAAQLADGDTALKIGSREDLFTKMKGDIAELLIYDASLSEADRKSVELYLAGKYGLTLTTPLNTVPTVKITGPADSSTYEAPASVTVTADASDPDGSIASVDFYVNGAKVASDNTAPYSAVLNFPAADQPSITAVAVDNLGGRTTSDPIKITVNTKAIIPLPAAANLKFWVEADKGVTKDGSNVTAWEDQSGNLNVATQANPDNQPTFVDAELNGKPVIRFDGDNDYLSVPNSPSVAIAGDISTFFVVRFDDFDTYRAVWAKTENNVPRATDFYTLPGSGIPQVYRGGQGEAPSPGTNPLTAGEFQIVGFDMVGTTVHHYLNGDPNGEGEITVPIRDTGQPLLIGTRGDLFTKMKGDIAEIIIYNSGLSEEDRNKVFTYLKEKYGLGRGGGNGPTLTAAIGANNTLVLSWPSDPAGFDLEASDTVNGTYTKVTEPVVPNGNNNTVSVAMTGQARFFRLRSP